jgi:ATP/maltotriose-dependent transcriptional regulator MalT
MALERSWRPTSGLVPAKTRIPAVSGLDRTRLTGRLADVWDHPVTLAVGPAGYGKTTLLAQMADAARASGAPVAWYQASAAESDAEELLRHLDHTLRCALHPAYAGGRWKTVEDAAASLEEWADRPTLLVIDDLHALTGTAADAALEQLVGYLPRHLHLLAASRGVTGWNMSRLRV